MVARKEREREKDRKRERRECLCTLAGWMVPPTHIQGGFSPLNALWEHLSDTPRAELY
jgi:hypothetical protein